MKPMTRNPIVRIALALAVLLGARTDGQAPTRVKTVELEMQKLTTQVP